MREQGGVGTHRYTPNVGIIWRSTANQRPSAKMLSMSCAAKRPAPRTQIHVVMLAVRAFAKKQEIRNAKATYTLP